jgi:fructose-bisphosphate aldolase class I
MSIADQLQATIEQIVQPGKGILAADESLPTIAKRFASINIDSTAHNRKNYRALLFAAPDLDKYISGVIEFEETLAHGDETGSPLHKKLSKRGIVPGIKVDKGTGTLAHSPGDLTTFGLDGLAERLESYKKQGMRFAKWRAVYKIGDHNPTRIGISANAEMLARYAAICQEHGIVPIVEPEVLPEGTHDIGLCGDVTEAVHEETFHALYRHKVTLEHMILKPNMVTQGTDHANSSTPEQVAEATILAFRRTVPAAVPSINFLSGGMSPKIATANLNAMNAAFPNSPWALSFSFGRGLQQPVLNTWLGKAKNAEAAQKALLKRARLNSAAQQGEYNEAMEAED